MVSNIHIILLVLSYLLNQPIGLCLSMVSNTFLGGAAVFAGRPGKCRKKPLVGLNSNGLIEDWHRCVKHLSVSSRESQAHRLIDGSGGYWQSSGSQGKVRSSSSGTGYNNNSNVTD